jgi:predicted dehydrogenase
MAVKHAAAVHLREGAEFVAVSDPVVPPEVIKARFGAEVATFTGPHSMLAIVNPDPAHIMTPPGTLADPARLCLCNPAPTCTWRSPST